MDIDPSIKEIILEQHYSNPSFLKIGAHDGTSCKFIKYWDGVFVEPVPYLAAILKQNGYKVETCAVSDNHSERDFFYIDHSATKTIPTWCTAIGSFDRQHILNHRPDLEPYIIKIRVQVTTVDQLRKKHNLYPLHLLAIDAEGHDTKIIDAMDFSDPPSLIIFEYKHIKESDLQNTIKLLESHGYTLTKFKVDYLARI